MTLFLLVMLVTGINEPDEGWVRIQQVVGKYSNKPDCEATIDSLSKGSIKSVTYMCIRAKK